MKYLFVTLMWNARAEMPGPGDIFAVCCQSYSPNGMTRYGRYTHLDDMSALTQWTKMLFTTISRYWKQQSREKRF